ncbi:MAG: 50S ribosomal protein L22 [Puniceicoccales bacterium]|jgi:large subunit ribosomal protein L22|nr:50S ribosomal protein L22 [Puniceicoccales bacterium]
MKYKATAFTVRVSPPKLRQVARVLRGRSARDGRDLLRFIPRKPARMIEKVLRSAIANAENNANVAEEHLLIDSVIIEEGVTMKRHIPAAKGSAHPIRKRTSHIRVILADRQV